MKKDKYSEDQLISNIEGTLFLIPEGPLFPKPYLCEIHGERYEEVVFGDQDGTSTTVFCAECIRLKLLECGLKPMKRIERPSSGE